MKRITLFLLLWGWHATNAQDFSVKWSDKFNVTTDFFTDTKYMKSLPASGGNTISLFGRMKMAKWISDFVLVKFSSKPEVTANLALNYPSARKEAFVDFVKLKNNFYIITTRFTSKDNTDLLVNKLNIETLKIEPAEKKIMSIDESQTNNGILGFGGGANFTSYYLSLNYSSDSSKLLISYEPRQSRKDEKSIQFAVMNDNLEKIYTTKHTWSEAFNKFDITDVSVDNYGNAYFAYNLYEKSFEKSFVKSDGDKIPSYSTYVTIFSDDKTKKTFSFFNKGNFIHQPGIGYNEKQEVILLGLYKDKYNGRLTGVFRSEPVAAAQGKTLLNVTFTLFPQALLELIDKDDQGKNSGNKPGLDNDFRAGYIVSVSDGVNHLISEYFDIDYSGAYNESTKYTKGDFLVATFLPDGKVNFQRLPKHQQTRNDFVFTNLTSLNAFTPTYFEGNLLLFYNDDEENVKKDISDKPKRITAETGMDLTVIVMTHEGKLVTRKIVYSHKDIKGYVADLKLTGIGDDSYIVFAFDPGMFAHGIKVGILTIK